MWRILPARHSILQPELRRPGAASRGGLGAGIPPRQDGHTHGLWHILRRQPERTLQRSCRERRAPLLTQLVGFSSTVLSAGCIPGPQKPAIHSKGNRSPPQGPVLPELGFHGAATVAR